MLLRGERNRTRRWSESGDYGTIGNSGRGRNGFTTTAIRKNALPLRRYFRRSSDYLGLAHLVGVDANRGALDRLSRGKGTLRHRYYSIAIYVVDVRDVDVGNINVCDPRVSDVHLADVPLGHMIRGVVRFAGAEWEPADETAAPTTHRDTHAESSTTDESDQRRSIVNTCRDRPGAPAPTVIDISPASIVKRREAPGFIIHPGPAPGFHPGPAPLVIGGPARRDARSPYRAIVRRVAPIAIGIQIFIADHVG